MKTEFVLFGKSINMASRVRRRWLVVLVYAGLATFMAGFWFLDHWQGQSMVFLFCAASLANSFFSAALGLAG
ncbi:MAG: hypothetical protein ABSE51_07960 [Terracidiphilus sp.]|jgi:hypothetical protein